MTTSTPASIAAQRMGLCRYLGYLAYSTIAALTLQVMTAPYAQFLGLLTIFVQLTLAMAFRLHIDLRSSQINAIFRPSLKPS